MNQKSLANRFLDAFSIIESVFKSWNNSTKSYSFSNYVHYFSKSHSLIRRYRDNLLEYSQLRNAIVHDRAGDNEIIAEPHEDVVLEIESIAEKLSNPPRISSVKLNHLVSVQYHDPLIEAVIKMNDYDYPQLPVLDGTTVIGVMTYTMIMDYLLRNRQGESITLKDVKVFDILDTKHKASFELMFTDAQIIDIIDMFHSYQEKGDYLAAVILLDENSQKKGPVGILTSRDIPRLLDAQQNS